MWRNIKINVENIKNECEKNIKNRCGEFKISLIDENTHSYKAMFLLSSLYFFGAGVI